jgi:hypothetical protein
MDESGIASIRARALDRFVVLARHLLRAGARRQSVMLSCAQYWCDEAEDAVQESVVLSHRLVPTKPAEEIPWELQNKLLAWTANTDAVWAFSAMCVEEGYEEITGRVNVELKEIYRAVSSPLAIAQRAGSRMRVRWLGALHRAWWDFPQAALRERSYPFPAATTSTEPPPRPLLGDEPVLVEQLLAGDDGALEVLRDVWTLRGDPRGEFCALAGARPTPTRAADLVAEYGRAWVGALQPVIPLSGALFGPGPFVRKAIVYADRETFERVLDRPEWGTVEAIEFAEGSHRALSPRMHRLHAVGPLGRDQLPALNGHPIAELEYELASDEALLARIDLPLRVLRLRGSLIDVAALSRAAWWPSLERLELWLPTGTADDPDVRTRARAAADAIATAFERLARDVPASLTIAVGRLDCGVRSGWVLARAQGERRIEVVRPDDNPEIARELAARTRLPLPDHLLDGDDWLALALGVASEHAL